MRKFSTLLALLLLVAWVGAASAANPITKEEVLKAQETWAQGLVEIGKTYQDGGNYQQAARDLINKLYAYEYGPVLFKPTKASEVQFRDTKEKALSYFVGKDIKEDDGFALTPWSKVRFDEKDRHMLIEDNFAVVMGNYYFTQAKTKEEVKVEYTFGYKRAPDDGRLVIFLQHSSLPFVKK